MFSSVTALTRRLRGLALAGAVLALVPSGVSAQDGRLRTYGFFDLELEASNRDPNDFTSTFDQHHFNVVTIFEISPRWRVVGEIEWEHGVALSAGGGSGQLALERAFVEYTFQDALRIRAGKLLTPFGIYNLSHDATPTFLSSSLPSSLYGSHGNPLGGSQRLYSKFSTGLEVLGTVFPGHWQADYAVVLANGRGPEPGESDNDDNKGVGARVTLQSPEGLVRVGSSFYQDRNGEASATLQRTVAFDVTLAAADFRLETEAFLPQLETVDAAGTPTGVMRSSLGYYAQASYAGGAPVTPFARYDFFDPDTDAADNGERTLTAGLNVAAAAFAFLKGEVQFRSFEDPARASYELFLFSVAVAF